MRILKLCNECHKNGEVDNAAVLTITNDNVYIVVCDKGHTQKLSIPHLKHEVLFEFGVSAIVDGYYREAISSFAASLERYYEHFIRVVSQRFSTTLEDSWKEVKSQSERQLGAYIFLHLHIFGECPELLPNSLIKLRNESIHKGIIPTKDKAIKFGENVAELINSGTNNLHEHFGGQLREVLRQVMFPDDLSSDNAIYIGEMYLSSLCPRELSDLATYIKNKQTHNKSKY
ncbi:hypothetical protein B7978_11025 [Vibrio cholerae]|uniref:hypothetical protein n=1 Tax=Vibrio cholerae TaxID=666 RepID=UPI000A120696|nr:hypothetical protein [Vibrio cholerae]ORP13054.1 hypothetical protein B7978_11025 [Vibrio cholerae]